MAITTTAFVMTEKVLAGCFRVQVLGIDSWGEGPFCESFQKAAEYAAQANANGHNCVLHSLG